VSHDQALNSINNSAGPLYRSGPSCSGLMLFALLPALSAVGDFRKSWPDLKVRVQRRPGRKSAVDELHPRLERTPALAGGARHSPMSETFSKVEVITGVARRRRFTTEQKLLVVNETL
jgi:hypothetical protein